MLLGVIADDFTGASDIANTLAKGLPGEGGLDTVQLLGVPEDAAPHRSRGRRGRAEEPVDRRPRRRSSNRCAALRWLLAQGCRQIVFKYCSTFDSTPRGQHRPGRRGAGRGAGRRWASSPARLSRPPAAPSTRAICSSHDRLLNESGLREPSAQPDDRPRHPPLARPARRRTGRARRPGRSCGRAPTAIAAALAEAAARGERLAIVDALTEDDLVAIGAGRRGRAAGHRRLGHRARAAAQFHRPRPGEAARRAAVAGVDGPEAILAGSCSGATRAQVAVHAERHPTLEIDVERVLEGAWAPTTSPPSCARNEGRAPLVYLLGVARQGRGSCRTATAASSVAAASRPAVRRDGASAGGGRGEPARRGGRRDLRRGRLGPRSRLRSPSAARSTRACRCWCRAARRRSPWR